MSQQIQNPERLHTFPLSQSSSLKETFFSLKRNLLHEQSLKRATFTRLKTKTKPKTNLSEMETSDSGDETERVNETPFEWEEAECVRATGRRRIFESQNTARRRKAERTTTVEKRTKAESRKSERRRSNERSREFERLWGESLRG